MSAAADPPAKLYRAAVRQLCVNYVPPEGHDTDRDFLHYLETTYAAEHASLAAAMKAGAPGNTIEASRSGIFVLAAGLFAYGRLDVADDILSNTPASGAIRHLALALQALLPLPSDMDPLRDLDRVRAWLRAHGRALQWRESLGKFVADAAP